MLNYILKYNQLHHPFFRFFLVTFFLLFLITQLNAEPTLDNKIIGYYPIQGEVVDYIPEGAFIDQEEVTGLMELCETFYQLANDYDPALTAIVVEINTPDITFSQFFELRKAIKKVKLAGIPVFIYAHSLTNHEYFFSTAADAIYLLPTGEIQYNGLYMELVYVKELLDYLEISPQILNVGEYKGAQETFNRTEPSEFMREQINFLLNDYYALLVSALENERGIEQDAANHIIDRGFFSAAEAKENNMIDGFYYPEEFISFLKRKYGQSVQLVQNYNVQSRAFNPDEVTNLLQLLSLFQGGTTFTNTNPKVAVIFAEGIISLGESANTLFGAKILGSETMVEALKTARDDETVKSIVVRVDSPGGSALASDIIWHEIQRTNEVKPVIVSMGSVSASGGYYISAAASHILSTPFTIVGSIGVFGGKFNLRGFYNMIGIHKEVFTRGRNAGIFSDYRDFTSSEQEVLNDSMQRTYNQFLNVVSQGREIPLEETENLAHGRIYSGVRAKQLDLVDNLGTLSDAISLAMEQANLTRDTADLLILPPAKSLFEMIGEMFGVQQLPMGNSFSLIQMLSVFQETKQLIENAKIIFNLIHQEKNICLMPYYLQLK